MNKKESLKAIFNHYGKIGQQFKLMEECAELIRALARADKENIKEETADVLILIEQFMLDADFARAVKKIQNEKIKRTLKRIWVEEDNPPCLAVDCLGCARSDEDCRMK